MKYIKNKPKQSDIDAKFKKINIIDIAEAKELIVLLSSGREHYDR